MPPGKRRQSNAMLYTLITFVGLFIVATTVAVIYYVKAEELRTTTADAQSELAEMASSNEIRLVGELVGAQMSGESNLGTLLRYFDQVTGLVLGQPVQTTSAEVKAKNAADAVAALMVKAQPYIALPAADANDPNGPDPNDAALTTMMADLLAGLEQTIEQKDAVALQLQKLQERFDDATAVWQQTREDLTARVNEYKTQVDQTTADYDDLKALMEQSSEQRASNLLKQLEDERATSRQLNQDLLRTQAELQVAQERLDDALTQVSKIQPQPDQEAAAQNADGQIILVDDAAGIVHINLGSDDRVYRGLTFSVYDKASGVPRDGKPKAEVEIFSIARKTSIARVLSSEARNPIATNDIVANLIWDTEKVNQFVITGDYDLNNDGKPDYNATGSIQALIEKWGGAVADAISAKTDFVIIGTEPVVPPEPTLEILAADPTARERYNAAQARLMQYNEIQQQAQSLYIPIFTYERFLHVIGYQSQVGKAGAF
ncbi:MAG: hypothetical protein JSW27_15775 [Phycisphaerales bacterium]|nr:MAG: hypothetical protein JSW27_15775 [Phycisphaerales bacterium]